MFMRNVKNRTRDDRGVALVSVMICVMLCFLLSATIMRVSFLSFLQKSVKTASVDAFYSTEAYMDDLKEGMQQVAAKAIASTATATSNKSQAFITNIASQITTAGGARDFLDGMLDKTNGGGRVKIESAGVVVTENGGKELVIKDVVIEYESFEGNESAGANGYYSKVKTDIRFTAPYYEVTSPGTGGGSYSMFAGSGAFVASGKSNPNANELGNFEQRGNVYVGYDFKDTSKPHSDSAASGGGRTINYAPALTVRQHMSYYCSGENIVINGDVYIEDSSNLIFAPQKDWVYKYDNNGNIQVTNGVKQTETVYQSVTIRGTIYISSNCHLVISNRTNLTCKDIVINGKSIQDEYDKDTNPTGYKYPTSTASIDGVPICKDSSHRTGRQTWDSQVASVSIYTLPEKTSNITQTPLERYTKGTTEHAHSKPSNITFKADIHPVANVSKTEGKISSYTEAGQVDAELAKIVNVAVLNEAMAAGKLGSKNPYVYLNKTNYSEGTGGVWTVTYGSENAVGNDSGTPVGWKGEETLSKYFDKNGVLQNIPKPISVNVGQNIQVSNQNCGYFMINWNENNQTFGTFNNSGTIWGMFFCKRKGEFTHTGDLLVAESFYNYYNNNNETIKEILHFIGTGLVTQSKAYYDKCLINNMIKGGMGKLYPGKSGGGNTNPGETKVVGRNMNLDIVTFENWARQ